MATVRVPLIRAAGDKDSTATVVWPEHYEAATIWRRNLSAAHHIKFRQELHGSELLSGQGRLHKSNRSLRREEAVTVYRGAMESLSFLPDCSIMAAVATPDTKLFGETKMTAALTGLLQRIRRQTDAENTGGMAFFDEGHNEYLHTFRKAQRYLPVGSSQGGWPEGPTQNRPLNLFIEDGNPKSSKTSYLIQIADLVAYAVQQKIKAERGLLSQRRRDLGHHTLYEAIPIAKRNIEAQKSRKDGIAII